VRISPTYPALGRSARRVQRLASALRRRSQRTPTIFVEEVGRCRRLITRPAPSLPDLAFAARHYAKTDTERAQTRGLRNVRSSPPFLRFVRTRVCEVVGRLGIVRPSAASEPTCGPGGYAEGQHDDQEQNSHSWVKRVETHCGRG
jgi:hypothetical protein